MGNKIVGLVNLHHSPTLGGLTERRCLASVSFLSRYALMDFTLSNMVNSDIDYIGVLAPDSIRSLTKHIGAGGPWMTNTKNSKVQVLYDEPHAHQLGYNSDVNNIRENWWFLEESRADYVLFAPAHVLHIMDYRQLLSYAKAMGARCTMVYAKVNDLDDEARGGLLVDVDSQYNITRMYANRGDRTEGIASLGIVLMDRSFLYQVMSLAQSSSSFFSILDVLVTHCQELGIKGYEYAGPYMRRIDTFSHYYRYSLELLDPQLRRKLIQPGWPIYTKSYDTPPAFYAKTCEVRDSAIANGCIIEGTVRHSILGRDVVVESGAVVEDSIILSGSRICAGAQVRCAVLDKDCSVVTAGLHIEGTPAAPAFIKRGDRV